MISMEGDKAMANLQLKKTILEVVDNQLKLNDPPCTKDVYEKLLDSGYSKSEAKDRIGAVALTEIYDILKEGKSFDEARYQKSLEEMLQQILDFEDNHHIETEWDKWDKFEESIKNWEMDEDEIFDEFTAPKQIPVVKAEKIYPNDPCPCGSGKKYKKCCGRK